MSENEPNLLKIQAIDYVESALKAALGAIPFAGSLLSELVGYVIPNQRTDRIVRFIEVLDKRLASLEKGYVLSQLKNENFTDLFEESVRQAAHSLSDERREYLANLITNSLSQHDIEYNESKHLLRILGELNDIEIIWLRYYSIISKGGNDEFRNKHANILTNVVVTRPDQSNLIDKKSLQNSYKEHLTQLGLLSPRYKTDSQTHLPVFDTNTGAPEIHTYSITPLGRLLIKQISLSNSEKHK
jgi:hypothetical protein